MNNTETVLKEFTVSASQQLEQRCEEANGLESLLVNLKKLFQKNVLEATGGTSIESCLHTAKRKE